MKRNPLDQWLPVASFVICFLTICIATLFYQPSWGLMDDAGLLNMARMYWKDPANTAIVSENFMAAGMYRPVVFIWAAIFYKVFEGWPPGLYIFIAAGNMLAMLLWGFVFYRFFQVRREDLYWTVFFFPLTFFIFTPFWNIFTYLSVQEKFVVFFAPLVFYFFQKTYCDHRPKDMILLYVLLIAGMLSKATFIFVPVAMLVYAVADLLFFRTKTPVSLTHLMVTGISLVYYAFYTLTVQLKGDYTAKFKSGLTLGGLIAKVMGANLLAKALLLTGVIGFLIFFVWAVRLRNGKNFYPAMIYCGLVVHMTLLLLWGMHSYLLSAIGPLVLGAFFPLYSWIIRKDGFWKACINIVIILTVCFVFAGNNIPSISRMADIGKAIAFIREKKGSAEDVYFMPPGYVETTQTTEKLTGKRILYCGDGKITEGLLDREGKNYVILMDLLPSIELSDVRIGPQVYANRTWQVFEVIADPGNVQRFSVRFEKTLAQKLKTKIKEL